MMRGMRVRSTIKDVAKEANVSVSTVSRVLNYPDTVHTKTRGAVLRAIDKLNFRPSSHARHMVGAKTPTLGFVVTGIHNFYFNELFLGVQSTATLQGMDVLLYDVGSNMENIYSGLAKMKERDCDALLFTSAFVDETIAAAIRSLDIPVALLLTGGVDTKLPSFMVDDTSAALDATTYLISRGHEHIAMISGPLADKTTGLTRYNGFRRALETHHMTFREEYVAFGDYHFESGYRAMEMLLQKRRFHPFTAVFAASDEMALGAARKLQEQGFSIPADVSIMGFDDLPIAQMTTPQLTTVNQPFFSIGQSAAAYLDTALKGGTSSTDAMTKYFPYHIVERDSVRKINKESGG